MADNSLFAEQKINKCLKFKSVRLNLSKLGLKNPIPKNIIKCRHLKILDISDNNLSSFPKEILELKNLKELNLKRNYIQMVPEDILKLKNLNTLYIYHNRIKYIPKTIGEIKGLRELKLHNNQLEIIPDEIGKLNQLRALYLNHNKLHYLPPSIGDLNSLSVIMVEGNPLPDTVITACNRGIPELRSYLRSLREEVEQLYEAKLILVGEGAVGKTSLVSAMKKERFIENRETTHGIEICILSLPHPNGSDTIKLNVWDFGGQPVYRVTHQFFYSKRSLYLLLWSPRRGVEQCDVEGWIKRIRLRVGNEAKIIIVATHSQTGDRIARIDKNILLRDFGDIIVGFNEVDSKTGAGINSLKKKISQIASSLPQMGSPFSGNWKKARDEILNLGLPRITFDKFSEICKRFNLDSDAKTTLADLMHDLGYIVFYGDDEGLANEVILLPEWLTKAIGFVLEDNITNKQKGVIEHSRLYDIWWNHSIKNREKYKPEMHPFFLRLMEKYDVSYRLEGHKSSLVTQLVPEIRPELPWTPEESPSETDDLVQINLICQMDDNPPGIIPWMIVRTHHFSTRPRLHWQKGLFLEYGSHGTALLELRNREFQIIVRSAWPNYFIEILRYILERLINERWPGLDVTFSVPCPQKDKLGNTCKGRFPLKTLHKLKAQFNSVPCMSCSKTTSIDKLIIGFTPPDFKKQLDRIEKQTKLTKSQVDKIYSENELRFRALLRSMNSATKECPHLFTLIPADAKFSFKDIGNNNFRFNLWCEMPGHQHPTCKIGSNGKGEYVFLKPKPWLQKISPFASLIAKILKTFIPIAGSGVKAAMDEILLKDFKGYIDLMDKVTTILLKGEYSSNSKISLEKLSISELEGASLRELHAFLNEIDPKKYWGGLKRTITPTGEYLWLCPEHYKLYDPGLPDLSVHKRLSLDPLKWIKRKSTR